MFRYLKAAFWAAPQFAGLGRLPLNVLALSGFGILGFGHAGFWLLGLALEGTYLYALVSSARFRQTSVRTLVTDMAAASRSPMGAKPELSM